VVAVDLVPEKTSQCHSVRQVIQIFIFMAAAPPGAAPM
jgi:hypothetical protein